MEQTSLLSVNPGLIFWTLITFVVLLLLLAKFVWGPIIAAVERRENSFKEMFDGAENAKNEAQQLLKNYEDQLAGARDDMNQILEEGKTKAGKVSDEIIGKANSEVD